jgi:galactarate dehydratase
MNEIARRIPHDPLTIRMHERDNVAIVANDGGLPKGTVLACGVTLREHIPQGHKVTLTDLRAAAAVLRYNVTIGTALHDIPAGSWINERQLNMPAAPDLSDLPIATRADEPMPPLTGYTFQGYRNTDGSAATRNILGITTTVQCVSGVVEHAVRRIKAELLPRFSNVDDVVGLEHSYGCGVAIDAPGAGVPIRTLRNISLNPNFGGATMVVGLGCEKLQPERLFPPGASAPFSLVTLQDESHVGFESMIASIMAMAETHLASLDARRRETCPAADLVVGLQCGGSDAFSGVTANPAVGFASDLLVRAGATVMFSEVTEVRDGIDQLTARAIDAEVAHALIHEMGGLSNIVEKAMGSIIKSGTAPISGVVEPGERARRKGLLFAATPASDFICGTLQMAAGMNLHVFTTGRGTPYGLAAVPVIKVATRSDLARRWHDLMDLDAGRIATGDATIEEVGWDLFRMLLDVASGKKTWAEHWRLANSLALFNPGPVT